MNIDPPYSETQLDALLEDYFDRRDRGEFLGSEAFSKLPPELATELRELVKFAEYLEEAVRPSEESQQTHQSEGNPLADTVKYTESDQSTGPSPEPASEILDHVGDYELLEELGRGGMGVVFKAHQAKLNRTVALKMILSGRMASENELQRFYSEARSVARLRHPNIVSIYDVQEADGHHFYSMDYIEGATLDDIARNNVLTEQQIARYGNLIAEAVEYAHQNGILHRDLKPANVLIDANDQPHVTDFGLAKQLEEESGLTLSGTILGTPSFMSPEQAAGRHEDVGPPSDVYALGAMLYFLLTGVPPIQGKTAAETISMVIHDEPKPLRSLNPRLSRAMVTICEKCLRKNPKERYQTAQELAVELERFLRGDPIQAQPISRFKRGWVWCRDIPLVAALVGRTPATNNRWQVRFQWFMLTIFACLGLLFAFNAIRAAMLPSEIRIASGDERGMYYDVAQHLSESLEETTGHPVLVLNTNGSLQNRDLLVRGEAHLGFLQASAVDIEQVAVVAPLYREFCFVIVRKDFQWDSQTPSLANLKGHTIAVGDPGSGNRASAIKILRFFDVTSQNTKFSEQHFSSLATNQSLHAAIAMTGLNNPSLSGVLSTGKFELVPIPPRGEIFEGSLFYPATLNREEFGFEFDLSEEYSTVTTPALLVVRDGERDAVVKAACEALMRNQWLETLPGHFSSETFDSWTKSLPLHPAAVRFFHSRR